MKVGLILECGPQGMEATICPHICSLLQKITGVTIEPEITPKENKRALIEECGATAANLLNDRCSHVVILWDQRPYWDIPGEPPNKRNDQKAILQNLKTAGVDPTLVHLVCIVQEFETWLLYDEQLLACVLTIPAHKLRVDKRPERIDNPRGKMIHLFDLHRGWHYGGIGQARHFVECLHDLGRMFRCSTFRLFAEKVTGKRFGRSGNLL